MNTTISANRRGRLVGRVVALATAASASVTVLAAAPASAVAPLTCGTVVTQSVQLSADITGCPGNGLVIGAANVTIDLNGHTLGGSGNGTAAAIGTGKGVSNPGGYDGLAITNGKVQDFFIGARLTDTVGTKVSKVTFLRVVRGVDVIDSKGTSVEDSIMTGLADAPGGMGVLVGGTSEGTVVGHNTFRGFRFNGIYVGDQATKTTVSKNTLSTSGNGIYVDGRGTTVEANLSHHNTGWGIAFSSPHCYDSGACYSGGSGVVRDNLASSNGLDGIAIGNASATVTGNQADYNADHGIEGWPGMVDGGGNHATGNTTTPQCTYVACA